MFKQFGQIRLGVGGWYPNRIFVAKAKYSRVKYSHTKSYIQTQILILSRYTFFIKAIHDLSLSSNITGASKVACLQCLPDSTHTLHKINNTGYSLVWLFCRCVLTSSIFVSHLKIRKYCLEMQVTCFDDPA